MTIFHYIYVRMHNIPNHVSIVGIDFMHYATKNKGARADMKWLITKPHGACMMLGSR